MSYRSKSRSQTNLRSKVSCIDPRCVPETIFNLEAEGKQHISGHLNCVLNSPSLSTLGSPWIPGQPPDIKSGKPTEAIVHRNAGGLVRTALADIAILTILVGLDEVLVIHHTDCGCLFYTDEQMKRSLKARFGPGHDEIIDAMDTSAIKE